MLADPHRFVQGAISYNLKLPPRHDSLSLFTTAIRAGHTPSFAVVPLLMLVFLLLGAVAGAAHRDRFHASARPGCWACSTC